MPLAAAQAMVRRNPDDADARLALAEAQVVAGLRQEAQASFEHALRLDPSLVSRHLGATELHPDAGDPAAALRILDLALTLKPDDPELLRLRAAIEDESAETRAVNEDVKQYFARLADRQP